MDEYPLEGSLGAEGGYDKCSINRMSYGNIEVKLLVYPLGD